MSIIINDDQLTMIDVFLKDIERSLGIKHGKVSFDEL